MLAFMLVNGFCSQAVLRPFQEREKKKEEKKQREEYVKSWSKPREDMECDDLKVESTKSLDFKAIMDVASDIRHSNTSTDVKIFLFAAGSASGDTGADEHSRRGSWGLGDSP